MERLTYWNEEYGCWSYHGPSGSAAKRLAAYENTGLEPEEIIELKARMEGRCVVLPCKIGDTLYETIKHRNSGMVEIVERTVLSVEKFRDDGYIKMQRWVPCRDTGDILKQRVDSWAKIEDFGKTVFLTRKEAEAALRREQDDE